MKSTNWALRGAFLAAAALIGQGAFAGSLSASVSFSLSQSVNFTYNANERNGQATVQFNAVKTGGTDTMVPTSFTFYCAELGETIGSGANDWPDVLPLLGSTTTGGVTFDAARTSNLGKLWANAFGSIGSDASLSAAFQLAQWEIVFDDDVTLGSETGDVFVTAGQYQGGITDVAESWLTNIRDNEWNDQVSLVLLTGPGIQDQITMAPEPATMGVLALGLGAIVARRRSRK